MNKIFLVLAIIGFGTVTQAKEQNKKLKKERTPATTVERELATGNLRNDHFKVISVEVNNKICVVSFVLGHGNGTSGSTAIDCLD